MSINSISFMIIRSWYVIAFFLVGFILYENTLENRESLHSQLHQKWKMLKKEKDSKLMLQEELEHHIKSYNDPDWIELILIKNLGLVPDGQQKIYLKNSKKNPQI